jgi:hypothetical protein
VLPQSILIVASISCDLCPSYAFYSISCLFTSLSGQFLVIWILCPSNPLAIYLLYQSACCRLDIMAIEYLVSRSCVRSTSFLFHIPFTALYFNTLLSLPNHQSAPAFVFSIRCRFCFFAVFTLSPISLFNILLLLWFFPAVIFSCYEYVFLNSCLLHLTHYTGCYAFILNLLYIIRLCLTQVKLLICAWPNGGNRLLLVPFFFPYHTLRACTLYTDKSSCEPAYSTPTSHLARMHRLHRHG